MSTLSPTLGRGWWRLFPDQAAAGRLLRLSDSVPLCVPSGRACLCHYRPQKHWPKAAPRMERQSRTTCASHAACAPRSHGLLTAEEAPEPCDVERGADVLIGEVAADLAASGGAVARVDRN